MAAEDRPHSSLFTSAALKQAAVIVFLCAYLLAGLFTDSIAVRRSGVLQDFRVYEVALHRALAHSDPYADRTLGAAFIYPLPALFWVELFSPIEPSTRLIVVYSLVNILMLLLMIAGVAHLHHLPLRRVWWWFLLGLGFAPFFELVQVGQINMVTAFAVFLMYFWQQTRPTLAGTALAVAVVTKVTPLAFAAYLLIQRNFRAIGGLILGLSVLVYAAGLRYGFTDQLTYVDVFGSMMRTYEIDHNAQSLVARLADNRFLGDPALVRLCAQVVSSERCPIQTVGSVATLQLLLTVYLGSLMILSGLIGVWLKRFDPVFVVAQIGVAIVPNILWYHHYIFLLLPLFVWMALSKLQPAVVVWCALGLLLIQVDREILTRGLLIHVFGHLTLLIVIAGQARDAFRRWQHRSSDTFETVAVNG